MTKLLVILLVPMLAVWTPMGRCCLLDTCDADEAAQHAATTPPAPAPAASHGCSACAEATPTQPAPAPAPADESNDSSDCSCNRMAATAPAERDAIAPTAPHSTLLPALNLWVALPYTLDLDAPRFALDASHGVGPPAPQPRSLLAQACQLTI